MTRKEHFTSKRKKTGRVWDNIMDDRRSRKIHNRYRSRHDGDNRENS